MIQQGGNDKLEEFLLKYDLMEEKDLHLRYQTRAADFYRQKLLAQAMD
jgi:hypothetical protein